MINQVTIVGFIRDLFTYDHEIYGEKYYRVVVSVERTSGAVDDIPVIISERLLFNCNPAVHSYVAIKGQFRSYKENTKLLLFVFATEIEEVEPDNINDVFIEGIIYTSPNYRVTPLGREITDILLKVPRAYNKYDFIPCVCWGRTAKYTSGLQVGNSLRVAGRVQSRDYYKNGETKTAYELSVSLVEVV